MSNGPFIVLCTDFGVEGPYIGQMTAVLCQQAPAASVINLFSNLPPYNAKAAAYLLPAYVSDFPRGSIFMCVVDPGVGSEQRKPVVVEADGYWFVGPDNGLFHVIADRASAPRCWEITWRPPRLSASFHGRDLFAPVAAMLARGASPPGESATLTRPGPPAWPGELAEVVYIDHFGNAMTGLRAASLKPGQRLAVKGEVLECARTFADVPPHHPFWYENANGLVEVAVNQGRADKDLGIRVGDTVHLEGDA